jgi:hypothetical protein
MFSKASSLNLYTLQKSNRLGYTFLNPSVLPKVIATGGAITNITVEGDFYKLHTFTSSGTFIVTNGGDIDYIVVASGGSGGGGDGNAHQGGGGGAGGLITGSLNIVPGSYNVVIGAAAAGSGGFYTAGRQGNDSTFAGLTAVFGGRGGGGTSGQTNNNGGSGGGGHRAYGTQYYSGGTGTSGQGNNGVGAFSSSGGGGGGKGSAASGINGGSGYDAGLLFLGQSAGATVLAKGGNGQFGADISASEFGNGSSGRNGGSLASAPGVVYIRYKA